MSIPQLRTRILSPELLPYTHQVLNIRKFLKENQQFFDKLASKLNAAKQQSHTLPGSRTVKSKSVSKFVLPKSPASKPVNYRDRNEYLQKQLRMLRQQETERQLQESPELASKQAEIESKSREVRNLAEINQQLRSVVEGNSDMFEMYDKMCRKCESIRKVNDDLTEEMKGCIKRLNALTNRDENPNLFIMNFK